ncbi:MAG: hypothetical protein KKA76_10135 [Proteobacteria bacterium]|nr:hypothetical protein [Pseudomonadota bacterium]
MTENSIDLPFIPLKIPLKNNMASIKKRKRKKGTVYKAEVRLKGHKYMSKTFNTLLEAREWARQTEKSLRSNHVEVAPTMSERISLLAGEIENIKEEVHNIKNLVNKIIRC